MKKRPGIAVGFVAVGALSFAVLYLLAGIGGALNRTSDGAYAPLARRGPSDLAMSSAYAAYFFAGAIASLTGGRAARLWLGGVVHAILALLLAWSAASARHPSVADTISLFVFGFFCTAIPMLLWLALLKRQSPADPNAYQ
jgi:hypothetical protein